MKPSPTPSPAARGRGLARAARYAAVAAALALVLLVAVYAAARVYLPALVARKADVEARLTALVGHPVGLGSVEIDWDGLRPGVRLREATVHGGDGQPSVRVAEVHASIASLPLLWGRVEIRRLELIRPRLSLERRADGRVQITGLATRPGGGAPGGIGWLLGLRHVVVRNGELRWHDAGDPTAPLSLSRIELSLENAGGRHRLAARAAFPEALCRACEVSADLSGVPFAGPLEGPWEGRIRLRAQGLDVGNLPLAVRERLPGEIHGRLDADLSTDWRDGHVRLARGEIAADGVQVKVDERKSFALEHLAADVSWRSDEGGWRLDLADLTLGLTGPPWRAGRLHLEHAGGRSRLEAEHVEVDDLTRFVRRHGVGPAWLRHWRELQPSGALTDVEVEISGTLDAPTDYAVSARLEDFGTAAHARRPSVRGVSGRIAFDERGGTLELAASGFALSLPAVFRAPLQAAHASGALRWHRSERAWHVMGTGLRVQGEDAGGSGNMALELPHDPGRSPVLNLRVDFRDGNGALARRYYPVHRLPPRVLAWMESAFVSGRITSGHLIYEGPVRAFPFEHGEGRFEIRAQVRDGVYRYLPGWTPLTEVDASVAIDGADALITGQGRIGALQARDIRVAVGRANEASDRSVRVSGIVEGSVSASARVLRAAESKHAPPWRAHLERIAKVSGSGRLDLDVRVPLPRGAGPSFQAVYRFDQAGFELDNGIAVGAATGTARFSEAGLQEGRMQARLYGGPVTVAVHREADGMRLDAQGTAVLARLLGDRAPIAQRVQGSFDWLLAWRAGGGRPRLRFESDLSRIRTRLPPPLDFPGSALAHRVTVSTQTSRADTIVLAVDGGPALSGKLLVRRGQEGWRFQKGRLDIGRPAGRLPAGEGLELGLDIDVLDVDGWVPLLTRENRHERAALVSGISARIGRVRLLDRNWGRLFLHVVRHNGQWRAVLDGDGVAGEATVTPGGEEAPRLRLNLAYLRLGSRVGEATASDTPADPRRLPALDLEARTFEYKQRRFGNLVLRAAPHPQGWRIEQFSLVRPETTLSAAGTWRRRGERNTSEFSLELRSEDLGSALDAWGARGQMAGGKVRLQADLSWPGTPAHPAVSGLNGRVEISAEKGRFLRFDPGAARLFGLLDLRAIARYLTLDFSPAFGKGLVFDAIRGTIAIETGDASTTGLILSGPALNLHAAGRVGLAQEDYDLVLEVSPRLSDTLTLTSWGLFGPQAAAAVLALQRLFRREIQESTRVTYIVKGPWDDPTVTRVAKPGLDDSDLPDPTP